jgi:hypothetical protein
VEADRYDGNSDKIFLKRPIMHHGIGYAFGSGGSRHGCSKSISAQEAIKIIQSFQYMYSSQTQAKSLVVIEKDALTIRSKFDFPLDSCGDSASEISASWYPVFLDGVSTAQTYCRDAASRDNERSGYEKVQVASFTSYERALEFAKAIGGRVGKPNE